MKAISLLLISLASLMGAQIEPVSTIDFATALRPASHHHHPWVVFLSASPDGLIIVGSSPPFGLTVARADRDGLKMSAVSSASGVSAFAARQDGSFWLAARWVSPFLPPQPVMGGGSGGIRGVGGGGARTPIGPPVVAGDPTAAGSAPFNSPVYPTSYFLYTPAGRRVESFQTLDFGTDLAVSTNKIAIVEPRLIRVGHVEKGNFVSDRDWRVNGPHLVFALDADRFVAINRFSGEFAILDPRTPDTRMVSTPFKSANRRNRLPVTAANGSIWFLVPGISPDTRDLFQLASDGSMVSRNTLRLEKGVRPLRIAISGRDVYLAGITAAVYRYELPQ